VQHAALTSPRAPLQPARPQTGRGFLLRDRSQWARWRRLPHRQKPQYQDQDDGEDQNAKAAGIYVAAVDEQ